MSDGFCEVCLEPIRESSICDICGREGFCDSCARPGEHDCDLDKISHVIAALKVENEALRSKSERLKVIVGKLESCDTCASQEGLHYCLLKGVSIKNMDITVCDEWTKKADGEV